MIVFFDKFSTTLTAPIAANPLGAAGDPVVLSLANNLPDWFIALANSGPWPSVYITLKSGVKETVIKCEPHIIPPLLVSYSTNKLSSYYGVTENWPVDTVVECRVNAEALIASSIEAIKYANSTQDAVVSGADTSVVLNSESVLNITGVDNPANADLTMPGISVQKEEFSVIASTTSPSVSISFSTPQLNSHTVYVENPTASSKTITFVGKPNVAPISLAANSILCAKFKANRYISHSITSTLAV